MLAAYADASDPDHRRRLRLLDASSEGLITTELVVAETGWLIDRQLGQTAEVATYADNDLGVVTRLSWGRRRAAAVETGATLDRRHFGAVRPKHLEAFTIVPWPA